MDPIELKLGSTIFFNEQEYIITGVDVLQDLQGRSLVVQAKDPMIAAQLSRELRARRAIAETQIKMVDSHMMDKMNRMMDDHEHEDDDSGPSSD